MITREKMKQLILSKNLGIKVYFGGQRRVAGGKSSCRIWFPKYYATSDKEAYNKKYET